MADFGYADGNFINLYSDENPMLAPGDACFFLFTSIDSIHRPILGRGIVIADKLLDDLSKIYYIQAQEFIETPISLNKFLFNSMPFMLYQYANDRVMGGKAYKLNCYYGAEFFANHLFKVEAFFVRNTLDKILSLRQSYIKIIRKDIVQQLQDIDEIM